jgi:Tol biopolymer transport system component
MFADGSPSVSPDGHRVAFSRSLSWFNWDIYVLDLTDDLRPKGEPRQLTFSKGIASSPVWTPNGREIIFNSYSSGSLYRMALSGSRDPEQLSFVRGAASSPAISPSGNRLVYQDNAHDHNIWRLSLSASGAAEGPPVRIIASTRMDWTAQYSADGKRIVFASGRAGAAGIWVSDADRDNAVLLFSRPGRFVGSPSWSPDGQRVAFDSNLAGNMDIYVIAASGGEPVRLTADLRDDNVPSWSRDGKWIYFTSVRSGRYEVWKAPANGGEAVQVTRNGGFAALESPDAKSVYYTDGTNESSMSLWRVPVSGGQESQVLSSIVFRGFALVDNGIYFVPEPGTDGKYSIQFLNQATERTETVARIQGPTDRGLSVSPDRRYLLYTQLDGAGSDLMLVENFR